MRALILRRVGLIEEGAGPIIIGRAAQAGVLRLQGFLARNGYPYMRLDPDTEARQFVAATGVDVLAPVVGNMHGLLQSMVQGAVQKRLDIEWIAEIAQATGIFMTLHGGSGTHDDDFRQAIKAGMTIVHVNTELRLAWRRGMEAALGQSPNEVVPYKILPGAVAAVREVVQQRLLLFNFS